jgi:hypothetical protein
MLKTGRIVERIVVSGLLALACVLPGCADTPKPRTVQPVVRDVPPLLRGMVGSEVSFSGVEPVLVSGYGLVVGVKAGGKELRDDIASTMEREMSRMGIGKAGEYPGTPLDGRTPRQVLRDPGVAVVLVQAAIPPGLPLGASFDVFVTAVNTDSLDGGTLWSTDLRLGQAVSFGGPQAQLIAKARGPIFVTPYSEKGREEQGVDAKNGRILDGGYVTNPLGIAMNLDNENHSRARAMVSAVNSRFAEQPGDSGPVARGRSGSIVEIRIPARYRRRPDEFLQTLIHLPIDQSFPEENARRFVQGLKDEPQFADAMAWGLEAIGSKAIPFIRPSYDSSEIAVQLAALKAGARLNDVRAAGALSDLAKNGQGVIRVQAIELLGRIDAGPAVDGTLRGLLSEESLSVRVAAYEALARRAEIARQARIEVALSDKRNEGYRPTITQVEQLARETISGRMLQGIDRRVVAGKFLLDLVPGGKGSPILYISQQGTPRIAIFGSTQDAAGSAASSTGSSTVAGERMGALIHRPMVAGVWNDRLLLAADEGSDQIRIQYRKDLESQVFRTSIAGDLPDLIDYLARGPSDVSGPGLDLAYSEVVGVLDALFKAGGTPASVALESDRLRKLLYEAGNPVSVAERPESPEDKELIYLKRSPSAGAPGVGPATDPTKAGPKVVPIEAPDPKKK